MMVNIHGKILKICTFVSELHDKTDLALGLKNIYELGGDSSTRDSCFKLLNRSVPLYPKEMIILKPQQQK